MSAFPTRLINDCLVISATNSVGAITNTTAAATTIGTTIIILANGMLVKRASS